MLSACTIARNTAKGEHAATHCTKYARSVFDKTVFAMIFLQQDTSIPEVTHSLPFFCKTGLKNLSLKGKAAFNA